MINVFIIIRFSDSLHPSPRYLNAGVLLMNLTRMRKFGWERNVLTIWNKYRNTIHNMNDQHVINILLHFNQHLLYRLPCHYNFMDQHCALNSSCQTVKNSSVQIIHGAGTYFSKANALRNLYLVYRRMNIFNLHFKSNLKFRNVVKKSFNNNPYRKSMCHNILSEIIK